MSMFLAKPGGQDQQQPFACPICHRGFTRRENLKRHAALHSPGPRGNDFACDFCHATFSRLDLRQRHMRNKHAGRVQKTCRRTDPLGARSRSHQEEVDVGSPESDSFSGSPPDFLAACNPNDGPDESEIAAIIQHATETDFTAQSECEASPVLAHAREAQPRPSLHGALDEWFPSAVQTTYGYGLFFEHISPFIPMLHAPTFDAGRVPLHMSLSMLSLAYQYGEDPDVDNSPGSGIDLATRCFARARGYIDAISKPSKDRMQDLGAVQSMLLLEMCSMLYICGEASAGGLEMHHRMVTFIRQAGLMQSPELRCGATEDLDAMWQEFAKSESLKRTLLAAHQIDALWYQFLSVPRSLSHLEMKCELPCPYSSWTAPSSQQWAHRQLLSDRPKTALDYGDAVRQFLAPETDMSTIPNFDPYGAINIAQFLLSSARELSGWTIMTGRLSLERFDPLRSSLVALEPFIRPPAGMADVSQSMACQAAWEMAMIELQVWWPSHILGTVLGSMDAFLEHATSTANSSEFCAEWNTAHAIKPHIEWFLCYLDSAETQPAEPPWLILYAYKAFLIAWKLLCHRLPEAMEVVGVQAGDREGALTWATAVFQRRKQSRLVSLISKCIEDLRGPEQ